MADNFSARFSALSGVASLTFKKVRGWGFCGVSLFFALLFYIFLGLASYGGGTRGRRPGSGVPVIGGRTLPRGSNRVSPLGARLNQNSNDRIATSRLVGGGNRSGNVSISG